MFSNIPNKGTTSIPGPIFEAISMKSTVELPTSVLNGGGFNSGSPGLTNPAKRSNKFILLSHLFPSYLLI